MLLVINQKSKSKDKSDSSYIPDDNNVWYGKNKIKKNIIKQTNLVPYMTYSNIDWYEIYQNRCVFYIWNDVTAKGGKHYRIANMTIAYYNGNGKWKFAEDFEDKFNFGILVLKYAFNDFFHCGDALWKLIKGGFSLLF